MCEKRYEEAIENASEILVDAMLGDVDELIEEGRQLDLKVKEILRRLGLSMMARLFEILAGVLVEEAKRRGFRIERNDSVTFKVLFGAVEVRSPYLRHDEQGLGLRPMREKFGVIGDQYSDGCERALSHFGSETSYEQASKDFAEHYGWHIGRTTVRSRTQSAAEAAEAYLAQRFDNARQAYDEPKAQRAVVDELLVEADGCMIRCGEFMSAAQARQRCEDDEELARLADYEDDELVRLMEYKEVRTGLVRRLEQVEPTYVCHRGKWEELTEQLFAVGCEHGLGFETQVVAVGDGGNGLKESLEISFAHLQFILDRRHLKEHFKECAEFLCEEGELEGSAEAWRCAHFDRLHRGEAAEVIADLQSRYNTMDSTEEGEDGQEQSPATARLGRLIDHLTRFCRCVNYDEYAANDWPIGSGEVESAHRSVPQRRLKLPGATWKPENLNKMCALRVVRENGWWDEMWQHECERRQAA